MQCEDLSVAKQDHIEEQIILKSWTDLPFEAWSMVGEYLNDITLVRSAAAAKALSESLQSKEQWSQRAHSAFMRLTALSERDLQEMRAVAFDEGRAGYVCRRSLFKGLKFFLQTGSRDSRHLEELIRWCGGAIARETESDIILVGPSGKSSSSSKVQRQARVLPSTLMASWIPSSCVVGRRLPRHRPGCTSDGSTFSLTRSCISPSPGELSHVLCCYAPRLLEGSLVTASRLQNREAIAATIRALGGEFTEELTRWHTHLIAGMAEGAKFDYAKKHRIPVVSIHWLDAILRNGMPMQERFFTVSGRHE